ncbi:MAG: DNA polymerase III subunit epsilon [Thermaurantiacus sp.]
MREIVLDTETTGLSPDDGHRLVEVAAIEMVERVATGRHFHAWVNPGRTMPPEAEAIHGLSDTFLADKPPFSSVVGGLLDFLADSPLVAHNASFDARFVAFELELCGHAPLPQGRWIDTLDIARRRFPGAKHTLDALCTRFGIDLSARGLHGALIDARLLADVYVELTGGRQIGLDLAMARSTVAAELPQGANTARTPRFFKPSEEHLAHHAAFVGTMTDPVWARSG